jgi:hypothetical protein
MDISADGAAVYAAASVNGGIVMLKSVDFGQRWTRLTSFPDVADLDEPPRLTLFDVVCSGEDADTVYVTDGYNIYKTVNGGGTWSTLPNLFNRLGLVDADNKPDAFIVDLDVGCYGGRPYVFAATSSFGLGLGGVYVLQEWSFIAPGLTWRLPTTGHSPTVAALTFWL